MDSTTDYIAPNCVDGTSIESIPLKNAYEKDTTGELNKIITAYRESGEAQELSFRSLVSWLKVGERATHYIHPYPAKLLPQIAHFFLAAREYFGYGLRVLDPFGGTGTVALEALLSGNKAYFSDANPLARLIAKVKTTSLPAEQIRAELSLVVNLYKKSRASSPPDVVNLEKWFQPATIRALVRLKSAIHQCRNGDIRDFFLIAFSATARKVSTADPRLSVPVQRKDLSTAETPDVLKVFLHQAESNIQRMKTYAEFDTAHAQAECVGFDARRIKKPGRWNAESEDDLEPSSIDLIITSPPYAGAQKYIRASSLSLGWLDLIESNKLKSLENKNIGREHLPKSTWSAPVTTSVDAANVVIEQVRAKNPLRAAIIATYLNEMELCIEEMARVLVDGGHLVLVIGNNEVCGQTFTSSEYLIEIAKKYSLYPVLKAVDEIKSRGLMTKRNKTAGVISIEWVILFRKSNSKELI